MSYLSVFFNENQHIHLNIRHITLQTEEIKALELLFKTSTDSTARKRNKEEFELKQDQIETFKALEEGGYI